MRCEHRSTVIDTLKGIRDVRDGFKSKAEAQRFIEDFYLRTGVIEPRAPKH